VDNHVATDHIVNGLDDITDWCRENNIETLVHAALGLERDRQ